ncbi:MAG: hypothetical protein ACRENI_15285 [Gemmatimonadaceae bacterium]
MIALIAMLIALGAAMAGFKLARRFVRERLRFVDAVQRRIAPFAAGLGAMLLAAPVALLLPIVGAGTAISVGLGVGFGVARGAKDVRLASFSMDRSSNF